MRKVGLFLPVAAFLLLAFPTAPRSAAGEAGSSGEAPAKTGFSTKPPEKKFDLKNLDLTKPPPGSTTSTGPGDQTEKPKPKPPVVR